MQPGKHTALEILEAIGDTFTIGQGDEALEVSAEDVFGNYRVRIGGIAGVNTPDHRINIQEGLESIEVIVGDKAYDLEITAPEEPEE